MATIINASNGSTSGLIQTGDASGILQLQTNNGTPALTLNTAQALGVGSSPAYGTAGQVLTSGGSGAAPSWTSPSAGAMTLISTQTASNSSFIEWTGLSGYNSYFLVFSNVTWSGSGDSLAMVIGTGSTTYITSNYATQFMQWYGGNSSIQGYNYQSEIGGLTYASISTQSYKQDGHTTFTGFNSGFYAKAITLSCYYDDQGNLKDNQINSSGICYGSSAQNTAIKLFCGRGIGNNLYGTFSLYGISS